MKKISIKMLASATLMAGAMFASTTSASACGRTYTTACVVTMPAPVKVVYAAPACNSCAPVCTRVWRTKTIKVWDPVLCCYVYKKVRRYKTVCK